MHTYTRYIYTREGSTAWLSSPGTMGTRMKEKSLERILVRPVKQSGSIALKFVSPGMAGVPDRLLLFTGAELLSAK